MCLKLIDSVAEEQDYEHPFPVADCPTCSKKDVPFGFSGPFIVDGTPICYYYCLNCGATPIGDLVIKGYVSMLDLEEAGLEGNI